MKKFFLLSIYIFVVCAACNPGSGAGVTSDTMPAAAADTMPVLHPGNVDTSGTIRTPPVHDDNVINPDTSTSLR